MTVTDTLAHIDYVLMVESNAAEAEWLLEEFDRKFDDVRILSRPEPADVFIRPMIEMVNDHRAYCLCEVPGAFRWSWSEDAYHSCGDVVCSECKRTVHELDAGWISYLSREVHSGRWVCLDCQPPPGRGIANFQEEIEIPLHFLLGVGTVRFRPESTPPIGGVDS